MLLGFLDGGDLLGHHRQHFHVNAIELIETGPRSRAVAHHTEDQLRSMDTMGMIMLAYIADLLHVCGVHTRRLSMQNNLHK